MNEFADSACSWAASGLCRTKLPCFSLTSMVSDTGFMAQWSFLYFASDEVKMTYCGDRNCSGLYVPPSYKDVTFVEASLLAAHFDGFVEQGGSDERASAETFEVNVLSCNPQTLRPRRKRKVHDPVKISKADAFEAQYSHRSIFLAGHQEARGFRAGTTTQGKYFVVASAARKGGTGGCSLWVAKEIPIGCKDGQKVFVQRQSLSLLDHCPRWIIVRISTSVVNVLVVVGHALDIQAHGEDAVQHWFEALGTAIRACRRKSDRLCLLLDANCTAPRGIPGCGDMAVSSSQHSLTLGNFLQDAELWVPSTYEDLCLKQASRGSFLSGGRYEPVLIDMVACDAATVVRPGSSATLVGFDMCADNLDHLPVMVTVSWRSEARHAVRKRRIARYNRRKVGDPVADEEFDRYCSTYVHPSASLEPSSHTFLANEFICEGLETCYPPGESIQKSLFGVKS